MLKFNKNNYSSYEIANFKPYRKDPRIIVYAAQINEPFKVESLEGWVNGKKGDYLMMGIDGELYPCDISIFYKTYIDANDDQFSNVLTENDELKLRIQNLQLELLKTQLEIDNIKDYLFGILDDNIWDELFEENDVN
jgi:hypothetical protein